MKLFGLEIRKSYAPTQPGNGWFNLVREPFTGAWQSGVELNTRDQVMAFSAVFACVTGIASDISKLRPKHVRRDKNGIWAEIDAETPIKTLLRNPNTHQNAIKFLEQWVLSMVLHGNAYVLKRRNGGRVVGMHVLDAPQVKPMITTSGDVYYSLGTDNLAALSDSEVQRTIPASEVIHDRINAMFHPLVGVSPIYACGSAATLGSKITDQSRALFANKSMPGGILTAPAKISDDTALRLKTYWETSYTAANAGKIAVLGDGLKYEQLSMSAVDAQLIEQLKWSVEDVARAFRYPLYKLQSGPMPTNNNIGALGQQYYTDCLQIFIECLEASLNDGLGLPENEGIELDIDGLMRMDSAALYDANSKGITGGWLAPNEARQRCNLSPVKGGEAPYLQQQNYSLADLAELRQREAAAMLAPPEPAPAPTPEPAPDIAGAVGKSIEPLIEQMTRMQAEIERQKAADEKPAAPDIGDLIDARLSAFLDSVKKAAPEPEPDVTADIVKRIREGFAHA